MRWAKSYSIIDHAFLHDGYFQKLEHGALVLYLFLVVVGNAEGRSYYSEKKIMALLGFDQQAFEKALRQLIKENLIEYQKPYWWVKNINGGQGYGINGKS